MQNESSTTELTDESKDDNRKKYICDLCERILFSRSGIRRHISNKHLGKRSSCAQLKTEVCNICGVYTTRRNFKDHVNSHSTAKNFKCDICGSSVKSIFTLRKHIKRVHMKVKTFVPSLSADIRTHCQICDKKFASENGLRKHEKRYHTDNLRHILCDICGKKSLTFAENNYHMKIHSLERKFECDFCEQRFSRSDSLKNHRIKHKAEWSYNCGLCSKNFKHSSSVSGHRKSHKVNGYYHCGSCDERLRDYGQLKNHFVSANHSFSSPIKVEVI